jgi:hypothetical protein
MVLCMPGGMRHTPRAGRDLGTCHPVCRAHFESARLGIPLRAQRTHDVTELSSGALLLGQPLGIYIYCPPQVVFNFVIEPSISRDGTPYSSPPNGRPAAPKDRLGLPREVTVLGSTKEVLEVIVWDPPRSFGYALRTPVLPIDRLEMILLETEGSGTRLRFNCLEGARTYRMRLAVLRGANGHADVGWLGRSTSIERLISSPGSREVWGCRCQVGACQC